MAFELAPLPYDYEALAPTIDAETMRFHHDKHHKAYTDKLNEGVAANPALEGKTIEEILSQISGQSALVRNNGGGFWNHNFFWESMSPNGGEPSGKLADAIAEFGGLDALKDAFNNKGAGQFGSGWAWLLTDASGKLSVGSTPNQDNPLMDTVDLHASPLLGNDVWEHAYYLTYRNDRAGYLKAWWNVVNWAEVGRRYDAIVGA